MECFHVFAKHFQSRLKGQDEVIFSSSLGPLVTKVLILNPGCEQFLARQYEVQESLCVTPGVGTVGTVVGVGGGVDT